MDSLLPVLITSIQAPTPSVEAILSVGHRVTIVGDRKSPPPEAFARVQGLRFLGLDEQLAMPGTLARLLPENSYARKNLGTLTFAREGVPAFLETDDDNAPLPHWQASLADQGTVGRVVTAPAGESPLAVNVCEFFGHPDIWPRGFPLREIHTPAPTATEGVCSASPWIVQGLANGEPDVDAIFRLVFPGQAVTFDDGLPVVLRAGAWCPFNSQNTLWRRPAFPLAYLPFTVAMRFTDILRGYVAQSCLRAAGQPMVFTRASVYQDRNPHDALSDFASELDSYLHAADIMEALSRLPLSGQIAPDLLTCYRKLREMRIVEAAEVEGVTAWLEDLESAGWTQ